jgi:Ni/Co efflux regulator RcnB
MTSAGAALADGCPAGLAKKDNGCMAPGQAKKADERRDDDRRTEDRRDDRKEDRKDDRREADQRDGDRRYRVGERIERDYIVVKEPRRYGLDPRYTYYRVADDVFRVDRDTREVLNFIGAASALLR